MGDILAVESDRGDIMAMADTRGDTTVMVVTEAVITTVTARGIIRAGTAVGGTAIIRVDIGGVLGAMLIQVGGGFIRPSVYTPITILIPIPIPILMPMIRLHPKAR